MVNPGPYGGQPADEPASSGQPAPPPPPPPYGPPGQPQYGPPGQQQYGQPQYPPPGQPQYGQPQYGPPAGGAAYGVGQPGNLADRFVAKFIDAIILGVVAFVLNLLFAIAFDSWLLTGFLLSVVTAALYLGYFGYFESSRGQTIGKQVMKLKVFGPDRVSNPTMEQAIRRNLYMGFSILRIVPFAGGLLSALAGLAAVIVVAVNINSDPQRQHWFDKFAGGTQVIKIG